jgi:hypothetical protein
MWAVDYWDVDPFSVMVIVYLKKITKGRDVATSFLYTFLFFFSVSKGSTCFELYAWLKTAGKKTANCSLIL